MYQVGYRTFLPRPLQDPAIFLQESYKVALKSSLQFQVSNTLLFSFDFHFYQIECRR